MSARWVAPLAVAAVCCVGCAGKSDRRDGSARAKPAIAAKAPKQTRPAVARTGSLYERLGGENAIRKVVDDFVARAAKDPAVNFSRRGHAAVAELTPGDMNRLKQRLVEFIATTADGPERLQYRGKDMVTAHRGMGISNAEFDALFGHLTSALEANGVPAREREELLCAVASTRGAIVEAPDQPEVAERPEDEGTTETGPIDESFVTVPQEEAMEGPSEADLAPGESPSEDPFDSETPETSDEPTEQSDTPTFEEQTGEEAQSEYDPD
jgi:hemoglobin